MADRRAEPIDAASRSGVDAYLELLAAFERAPGQAAASGCPRRRARATHAAAASRARLTGEALRLDPGLPTPRSRGVATPARHAGDAP